jgi:hypothetical protein
MRDLSGSGQYLTLASSLGITVPDDPVFAIIWAEFDSTVTSQVLLSMGVSGAGAERRYVLVSSNTVQAISHPAAGAVVASVAYSTTGVKVPVFAEWPTASLRAIQVGNGSRVTETTSRPMSSVPNQIRIGATHTASGPFNGRLGPIGIYRGTITADDKTATLAGIHPELIRPADQLDVIDLGGRNSPELSLKGNAYTITGSPGYADAPRLFRRRRQSMIFVPSSAGQTLTLPTIASTATLSVPTLAPGAVTLALPAIASTAALLAPTLAAGAVALGVPAIAAGAVLSAPALAAGAVNVSLPAIASVASLAPPTVAAGVASLLLPTIASGSTVSTPTLAPGELDLGLPAIASGAVLAAPAVAPGVAAVALPAIGSTSTLFAPTVVGAGAVALPAIASTATLGAPTLTAGPVSVSLPAIASASATYAPSLAGVAALALPTIASTSALYGPALVPSVMALTLPTLASTSALFSLTITDGAIPVYTVLRIGAARAGRNGLTARAGRSGLTARTHLSE